MFLLYAFFSVCIKQRKLPRKVLLVNIWSCTYSYGKLMMSKFFKLPSKKFWSWESSDSEFWVLFLSVIDWLSNFKQIMYVTLTVTCKIAVSLFLYWTQFNVHWKNKLQSASLFLKWKYIFFKITLTIMNCEPLEELDYNSNLVKFFLRIHCISSFGVLLLVGFHIFVFITFSFLGHKLIFF